MQSSSLHQRELQLEVTFATFQRRSNTTIFGVHAFSEYSRAPDVLQGSRILKISACMCDTITSRI
jgi:hypothetical protein